jgi:hypothetical protein
MKPLKALLVKLTLAILAVACVPVAQCATVTITRNTLTNIVEP